MRDERDALPGRLVEPGQRHAEDRAHRRTHGLRPGRIGAAVRERDAGAERVGGAQQRPDVSRIGDVPERERHGPRPARQVVPPEHRDDARRMRERRHLREQRRLDVLVRDEDVGRLEAGAEAGLDEILTLDREQPELVAPAPFLELAERA